MDSIMSSFHVYAYSFGDLNLTSATVTAPRVGLCARDATLINSVVNTTGRGCVSEMGLGGAKGSAVCSGTGGAHGG